MKKMFFLVYALIPTVIMAADWTKQFVEADELLGNTTSYYNYVYQPNEESAFAFRSDETDQFYIFGSHVFDTFYDNGRIFCKVLVGLYDGNGKMVDHFDMYLDVRNNQHTAIGTFHCGYMSQPMGQQKNTRKIFKHLRGSDGYVRFVADTYSHGKFDLKVNPIDIDL